MRICEDIIADHLAQAFAGPDEDPRDGVLGVPSDQLVATLVLRQSAQSRCLQGFGNLEER
ncbi:hypothetical protein ASG77_08410 [Arthrobacter sp. Soil762]|nr:hypothetical protein ASG77_08410 [Arthrobacter sp. Soil762]